MQHAHIKTQARTAAYSSNTTTCTSSPPDIAISLDDRTSKTTRDRRLRGCERYLARTITSVLERRQRGHKFRRATAAGCRHMIRRRHIHKTDHCWIAAARSGKDTRTNTVTMNKRASGASKHNQGWYRYILITLWL